MKLNMIQKWQTLTIQEQVIAKLDESETIWTNHILVGCTTTLNNEYLSGHDLMEKVIQKQLAIKCGLVLQVFTSVLQIQRIAN
jgi:hypothetical protein